MCKRVVLVAFNGDPMCFVHVLLNALDMKEKGYEAKIVIEGSATKLVNELTDEKKPFSKHLTLFLKFAIQQHTKPLKTYCIV